MLWNCVANERKIHRKSLWNFDSVTSHCVLLIDWFHLIVFQPTNYSTQVYSCIENHEWSCGIHTFPEELLKRLGWPKFSISSCHRFRHPMDEWIGRSILKIESELEYNNPTHWAAKHDLPLQGWEFNTWSALIGFVFPLQVGFFSAKGFKLHLTQEPDVASPQ